MLSESDFMKHLELAIQFGNPFLFENVDEELDPMLDPVLEKNVVKDGASMVIKLGDKMVEWDENFRLFFTTKLANPHYSPEVMGKTMIINYGKSSNPPCPILAFSTRFLHFTSQTPCEFLSTILTQSSSSLLPSPHQSPIQV